MSEEFQNIDTPDLLKRVTVALAELNDRQSLIEDMRLDLNRQEIIISQLNNELTKRLG